MKPIMTIDPGANGGICLKTPTSEIRCYKIPAGLLDKVNLLVELRTYLPEGSLNIMVEDVGFHREGSHAQGSAKLARHVGQIEGILTTIGVLLKAVAIQYVRAQTWMTVFPDRPKSLNTAEKVDLKAQYPSYSDKQFKKEIEKANAKRKTARKKYIKAKVQAVYPGVKVYARPDGTPSSKVTDWCADALGILMWAESQ